MSPRFQSKSITRPAPPFASRFFWGVILAGIVGAIICWPRHAKAEGGCAAMRAYAQASANDMARRDTMGEHDYFHAQPHVGGENIGWGYKTEARMVAGWWASPRHAANMRLRYPCKVIASARSRSGKLYWAMEIGE